MILALLEMKITLAHIHPCLAVFFPLQFRWVFFWLLFYLANKIQELKKKQPLA